VVVYSAPEAVVDKIAKMRSLGSLQAWGAITRVMNPRTCTHTPKSSMFSNNSDFSEGG
jgi:hypothetical protein